MSLSWYYYRLRTMSLPEMVFRSQQFWQKSREKKNKVDYKPVSLNLLEQPPQILPIGEISIGTSHQEIDIFGQKFSYNDTIDWHLDISSGKRFPSTFSKDINIRTEEFGSAKHVWEVNRMQFLTLIAMRFRSTQDEKYLAQFQEIVASWIDSNPYLLGVNWYSNIEVNIRLIVWFFCWEIMDVNAVIQSNPDFKRFVDEQWLPTIYLHMLYSYENPSKYSSANNHLISEHTGLFIASCFWKFEESAKWKMHAKAGLEQEIQLQHSEQGVNKEEAAEYIQFITDFFLLPFVVGKYSGNPFSASYSNQLENICEYIFQMMDLNGNIVYYGDEDDGKVLILEEKLHFDNFKSILTSGVILFKKAKWKQHAHPFDNKNAILFGDEGKKLFDEIEQSDQNNQSKYYIKEGHFILRNQQLKNKQEIFVHFDAASLGFLSIAAHGHSDALSFVLHVDGYPIITDSGTYTYHTEAEWRKYFIGAISHNTIRIDKTDQAMNAGPTMWLKHFNTKVLSQESNVQLDMVEASHDGYSKLGVEHRRQISLDKTTNVLEINDDLIYKKGQSHFIELPFHMHPEVEVEKINEHQYILKHPKARMVEITLPDNLKSEMVKGREDPLLGWFSPSFQLKEPTNVIYCFGDKGSTTKFTTRIKIIDS